jgi:DNA-binding response OmpR family regulator
VIVARRGMGYTLDVASDRVMAKFEDQLDILNLGPWTLDATRHTVSYSLDEGETSQSAELNKSQFSVFASIMTAYPHAIKKDALLTVVYGDDVEGKESALSSLYAQMKGALKSELGDYAGGFRKISNGDEYFRFDLDIDDIPTEILDACEVKEVGPWAINQTLNMFLFDGDPVELNDSEYAVVTSLLSAYPKPITTQDLAAKHFDGKQPSLNTCLTLLRKKVSETYAITEPFIQNKRGVGYMIIANKDELAEEQINATETIQIGDVSVNMDLGQLSFGGETIELSAAELFALNVLSKANKPVTAKILSDFSKAAGQDRESASMYQAVRSLEDKMSEAGFEGQLVDRRRDAGFFLASKRDEVIANSEIETIGEVSLNKTLYELTVAGQSVALTPSEFKFVATLAENPRIPLSLEDLSKLSDEDGQPFAESTLNVAKMKIKQKLLAAGVEEDKAVVIGHKVRAGYFLASMEEQLDPSRLKGKRDTAVTDKSVVTAGVLSINTITDRVEYEGVPLESVKGKPLDVLVLMAQRHGDFVGNEELAEHFFGKPANDKEKAKHLDNVERGIGSLRHMIDTSVPQLSQSIVMKVGDKGYGLTLSLEERDDLLDKAGLKKTKKVKFQSPHAKPNGNGKAVNDMSGAEKKTQPVAQRQGGRRKSMADQLAEFKLG